MGSAIAHRLMSVGHEWHEWNGHAPKTKPLTDAGAKLSASPAELVQDCEVTIIMLLNDAATEAVYWAPNGILKAKLAGKLLIDMSTIGPETMKANGSAALTQGGRPRRVSDVRCLGLITASYPRQEPIAGRNQQPIFFR